VTADLREYHRLFAHLFRRAEQRRWSLSYLSGLLQPDLGRKTIEHMARALPDGNIQALQQFIGVGAWSDDEVLAVHQRLVAETLGDEATGVLVVTRCDFAKQGSHSVGVAPQPSNGAIVNCQSSLIACYVSQRGCTIVDRRLFMPQEWFSPAYAERRRRSVVPTGLAFRSRSELAWDMVQTLHRRRVLPFRWATVGDQVGSESGPLERVLEDGLCYLVEIPLDTPVQVDGPGQGAAPTTPASLAADLPATAWSAGATEQPAALLPLAAGQSALPAAAALLVLRRPPGGAPRAYVTNLAADDPSDGLFRAMAAPAVAAAAVEVAVRELGMSDYEVRGWVGWHHHMTMAALAHHFLVGQRRRGAEA
jgi:SRSO17 transposase